jgi:hypothetical protein
MVAIDQIKRFERWRRKLPSNTAYLVNMILDEIVPLFLERGFGRYHDYAGGSTFAVGPNCIPLQRKSGNEWPTVEILFHKRQAPSFAVHFAALPEICYRWSLTEHRWIEIPRTQASVVEGSTYFSLCKGLNRNFDCNFGYRWFAISPREKLSKEVEALRVLLPWLFELFEGGIPPSWLAKSSGYVDRHAYMTRASRLNHSQVQATRE